MRTLCLLCSLLLAPIAPSAFAQSETPTPTATITPTATPTTPPPAPLSLDQNFLLAAAQLNQAEIDLSEVAAEDSNKSRVRKFAEKMVTDHTRFTDKLKLLAQSLGVTLPTELDAAHLGAQGR